MTRWTVYARDVLLQPDVQFDFEWFGACQRPALAACDALCFIYENNARADGSVVDPDAQAGLIEVAGVRWRVRIAWPTRMLMPHPTFPGASYISWIVV